VTGATDGIGKETARQFFRRGARVLLHGRTPEKAARTAK
jgi:short-subunit dehydrogenase